MQGYVIVLPLESKCGFPANIGFKSYPFPTIDVPAQLAELFTSEPLDLVVVYGERVVRARVRTKVSLLSTTGEETGEIVVYTGPIPESEEKKPLFGEWVLE